MAYSVLMCYGHSISSPSLTLPPSITSGLRVLVSGYENVHTLTQVTALCEFLTLSAFYSLTQLPIPEFPASQSLTNFRGIRRPYLHIGIYLDSAGTVKQKIIYTRFEAEFQHAQSYRYAKNYEYEFNFLQLIKYYKSVSVSETHPQKVLYAQKVRHTEISQLHNFRSRQHVTMLTTLNEAKLRCKCDSLKCDIYTAPSWGR